MAVNINRRGFLSRSMQTAGLLGFGSVLAGRGHAALPPNPDPRAVVETTAGKIRGGIADGVHIFRGVPYGADTGGANRFKPPQPLQPWSGVRDTLNYGSIAPQKPTFSGGAPDARALGTLFAPVNSQPQSEDCLYLNVWSRGVNKRGTRPVMVWLHGGGFTSGSGASSLYDGINLARRGDVVVVTVNHRLGALGYLDLSEVAGDDYARSGMAGMLDIVQALEWVRDNIAEFGGDPDKVMVFGESGGGRKVSTLLGMPGAEGLFHAAVIESGPGLRFASEDTTQRRTAALMEELGLEKNDFAALKRVPFEKIVAAQDAAERKANAALPPHADYFESYGWAPVKGPDLPQWPFDPKAAPSAKDVPVIIGTNRFEMALFFTPNKRLDDVDEKTLHGQVERLVGDAADDLIAVYREAYPQEDLRGILLLIASDNNYRMHSITLAERKVAQGGAPVYMYRFDWETPVWNGLLRASHALEIPFVFGNAQLSSAYTGGDPDAVALSAVMADTWMSFARNGNPNNDSLPEWKPYNVDDRPTMIFNNHTQLVNDPGMAERKAWQKIRG